MGERREWVTGERREWVVGEKREWVVSCCANEVGCYFR